MRALIRTLALCLASSVTFGVLAVGPAHAQAPPPAAAPSPQDVDKAQSLYEKGSDFFDKKKWALALEQFRASYATVPSPNSRLYIARCLDKLGENVEAYLEFDGVAEQAAERAQTEPRFAKTKDTATLERDEVAKKIALVTVTISHPESAASLQIAGKDVPRERWGKPHPVAPGNAEIVLRTSAGAPVTQSIALSAGDRKEVPLDAAPAAAPPPPGGEGMGGEGDVSVSTPTSRKELRPWAFVAGGVGVLGLGMFTVAGIMANGTYSDLSDSCGGPCPADREDDVSAGKTQQTLANVGLVVGAVGIAAGATLFILSLGGDDAGAEQTGARRELVVGPGYAGVRGTF